MKTKLLEILNRVKRNNSHTKRHDIVFEEVEKFITNMSDDFNKTEYRNLIRLVRKYRGHPRPCGKFSQMFPIESPIHWGVCETLISNFNCVYKQFKRIYYIIGTSNDFFIVDLDRFGLIYKVCSDKSYRIFAKTSGEISSKHSLTYFIDSPSFKIVDRNRFFKQLCNNQVNYLSEVESNFTYINSK